jgi:hypothetical protein
MMVVMLLFSTSMVAQDFHIPGQVAECTEQGDGYLVKVQLSPKGATNLIVNQIKSRQETEFVVKGQSYVVKYEDGRYLFNEQSFKKISDCRKEVRSFVRGKLGIR